MHLLLVMTAMWKLLCMEKVNILPCILVLLPSYQTRKGFSEYINWDRMERTGGGGEILGKKHFLRRGGVLKRKENRR